MIVKLSKVFVTLGVLSALLVTIVMKAMTQPQRCPQYWVYGKMSALQLPDAETPWHVKNVRYYRNTFTYSTSFGNLTGTYTVNGSSASRSAAKFQSLSI